MERVIAPYSYPKNIPSAVKNLPKGAQKLFIRVFNKVYKDTKNEKKARMAGWGAVKNRYVKKGGKWVLKKKTKANVESLELSVAGYNVYERENGDKEYSVTLNSSEGHIYLNYTTVPPKFLTDIGNTVSISLSDKDRTSKVTTISAFYPGNFVTHAVEEATKKEEKEQRARNKEYGIAILDNGHVNKPDQYSEVATIKFADPVNLHYPIDNAARAKIALQYFKMVRNYSQYSIKDRNKIWGRMIGLISKYVKDMDKTPPWKRKEG